MVEESGQKRNNGAKKYDERKKYSHSSNYYFFVKKPITAPTVPPTAPPTAVPTGPKADPITAPVPAPATAAIITVFVFASISDLESAVMIIGVAVIITITLPGIMPRISTSDDGTCKVVLRVSRKFAETLFQSLTAWKSVS